MTTDWIRNWIPSFLRIHSPLFVGDLTLRETMGCYVSKPKHEDSTTLYHAMFQPYLFSDREPLFRIEVEYRLDALDEATYRVQPMGWCS